MIVETERLFLRKIQIDDYEAICTILQDIDVMYAWEHAFSDDEVDAWINKNINRYTTDGYGYFAVILKGENKLIGVCGIISEIADNENYLGIGYIFNQNYWHKGYAFESASACMNYAFNVLKANEVTAQIRPENTSSKKIAEKLGMTVKKQFTKHYRDKDMPHLLFSVRRSMEDNKQNGNKDESTTIPKSIMTHYTINPEDSYFVNGSPPMETVEVVDYDCSWPEIYAEVASDIKNELGSSVQKIDHIGSTAVPGLAAKPWIDIDLTVADPTDEKSYVPALEKLGFKLIVREPRFHEHRLFHLEKPRVNLHVFGPDCPETIRHLLFRDWLRKSPDDCQLYANAKLEAVKGCEIDIAKYHENKQNVVHEIYTKIFKSLGLVDNKNVQNN